jgi:hypothetical protein
MASDQKNLSLPTARKIITAQDLYLQPELFATTALNFCMNFETNSIPYWGCTKKHRTQQ